MYTALQTALIVVSVLIIILVIMQPSKSNAASMLGSGDDGQPKTKARGFESFLIRATTIMAILFFVLAIVLAMISK